MIFHPLTASIYNIYVCHFVTVLIRYKSVSSTGNARGEYSCLNRVLRISWPLGDTTGPFEDIFSNSLLK